MIPDDRLRLVFTCCHPALAREAQVALTLRLVCGLTTDEIARAFLVPEATMAARVTRAKKKISAARIPYRVPDAAELPDRLDAVLTVVHLLYTTGHTAPAGADLVRADLVERALDLARMLRGLMPDEREVRGPARAAAAHRRAAATRSAPDGAVLLLEEQDRSQLGPGRRSPRARRSSSRRCAGPARAGSRCRPRSPPCTREAPTYDDTDWPQVLRLYDVLLRVWPSRSSRSTGRWRCPWCDGPAGRAGRGRGAGARTGGSRATATCRRPRPTCCAGWAASRGGAAYREAIALTDNEPERAFLARGAWPRSLPADRVGLGPDLADEVGREAPDLGVLADGVRVSGDVHAVEAVGGHVAVQPLRPPLELGDDLVGTRPRWRAAPRRSARRRRAARARRRTSASAALLGRVGQLQEVAARGPAAHRSQSPKPTVQPWVVLPSSPLS